METKSWINRHPILTFGIICLVPVVLGSMVGSDSSSTSTPVPEPVSEAPKPQASPRVSVGEEGYLRIDGQDQVLVPANKEANSAIVKASVANDTQGIMEVVASGQAYFVKSGTKVLVLSNSSLGTREIRILDGQFATRKGVVPMEFIHKQ